MSIDENMWQTVSSKPAYTCPYFVVREDVVKTPAGANGTYYTIESKPGVMVIAETDDRQIYLISSFRYPLQDWRWEIPGGGIEPQDTPLIAAQKELAEELGFTAARWTQLGDAYPSNNGPLNDHTYAFLAQGLVSKNVNHEAGEAISLPTAMDIEDVFTMVRRGELTDGQSLAALLQYKLWLENNHAD